MEKRNLLFYINSIGGGGAERVIVHVASLFSKNGYNVIMVTSFSKKNEYPLEAGIKYISLEKADEKQSWIKRNISRVVKLRNICKKEKPDVVISFMAEPNYRALVATFGMKVKNIISVRSDPNYEYAGIIGNFLGKYLLPVADGCIFQTEDAKNWFPKKLQKKSRIICNAVREEFYEVNYKPVSDRIVTCGRLEEAKNHKLLIDVFTAIAAKYPEAKLLIYGEGKMKDKLQKQISKNGMDNRIQLMGRTNNVAEILAEACVFILPSIVEGMPNALMEAMAVGVPCISTDCPCGGPRMLLRAEKTGILVRNNDQTEMVNALDYFLENKERRLSYGRNAKRAAEKYRSKYVFQEWKEYVEYILCE